MAEMSVKQQIREAIDRLPEDATLEDVAHLVKMHALLAQGRADSAAGRRYTTDQVRERLGLTSES